MARIDTRAKTDTRGLSPPGGRRRRKGRGTDRLYVFFSYFPPPFPDDLRLPWQLLHMLPSNRESLVNRAILPELDETAVTGDGTRSARLERVYAPALEANHYTDT